jgi:hypothetical protein
MRTAEVHSLVDQVAAVDYGCAEWGVLQAAVGDLRWLKSWVEGREVALAKLIAKVSSFPEKSLAEAARASLRQGEELLRRAETTEAVPSFGVSLDAGRVSAEHVDVLTRTLIPSLRAARMICWRNSPSYALTPSSHSWTAKAAVLVVRRSSSSRTTPPPVRTR